MAAIDLSQVPTSDRVRVPSIGRSTSRVGFGTGGLLRVSGARERQSVLAAALASGITHFDTAPVYGFGESERALGRFLRGRRGQVTLTTKFGLQPSRFAARLRFLQGAGRRVLAAFPAARRVAVRNAGALYAAPSFPLSAVQASLEASLRALRTEYVDFFLAHQASAQALPGEDVIELLQRLQRSGKILTFGVATEFDWLGPVLQMRPQLSVIRQYDSDLTRARELNVAGAKDGTVITYGCVGRSITSCRDRLQAVLRGERGGSTDVLNPDQRLSGLDVAADEHLGGLLLRAAVLANPRGIVLMQSRSQARIERNVRAANDPADDERVRALAALFGSRP